MCACLCICVYVCRPVQDWELPLLFAFPFVANDTPSPVPTRCALAPPPSRPSIGLSPHLLVCNETPAPPASRQLRCAEFTIIYVCRLIVYGDMGVGSHAEELVGELSSELRSGSAYDAILHLGDFCYNLPDPQARNWDIAEDWYIAHKQK